MFRFSSADGLIWPVPPCDVVAGRTREAAGMWFGRESLRVRCSRPCEEVGVFSACLRHLMPVGAPRAPVAWARGITSALQCAGARPGVSASDRAAGTRTIPYKLTRYDKSNNNINYNMRVVADIRGKYNQTIAFLCFYVAYCVYEDLREMKQHASCKHHNEH